MPYGKNLLAAFRSALFGGEKAKTPVEGTGFPDPASAVLLKNSEITRLGDDLLIESEVKQNVHGNC